MYSFFFYVGNKIGEIFLLLFSFYSESSANIGIFFEFTA